MLSMILTAIQIITILWVIVIIYKSKKITNTQHKKIEPEIAFQVTKEELHDMPKQDDSTTNKRYRINGDEFRKTVDLLLEEKEKTKASTFSLLKKYKISTCSIDKHATSEQQAKLKQLNDKNFVTDTVAYKVMIEQALNDKEESLKTTPISTLDLMKRYKTSLETFKKHCSQEQLLRLKRLQDLTIFHSREITKMKHSGNLRRNKSKCSI